MINPPPHLLTPTDPGSGSEDLPCKQCGTPTPAVKLPRSDGGTTLVPNTCPPCQSAMFADLDLSHQTEVTTKTKICETCSKEFQAVTAFLFGRTIDTVRFCEACSAAQNEKEKSKKQQAFEAARNAEWEAICPEFYRTKEIIAALPAEKLQKVKDAFKSGPGVLIHGKSGKFKTTAMFHGAILPLVWKQKSLRYIIASEWRAACSRAAKETNTLQFLKPFIACDYLFLDDVGNMAGTPAGEDALFQLTERRMQQSRPMLVTTQYTGAELAKRFLPAPDGGTSSLADAIIRRLQILTGTPIKFT